MENFWSALGQGMMNFGQQRQQRQDLDYERQRQEQLRQQAQAEKDRQYAWDVASNMAPDQELDDASWGVLQKAGPELGAYVGIDPLTGKRKWKGTQQQQTRAAQESAALEASRRNNAIVAKQEAEIARRESLNKAVADFTAKNGRRPTRDEIYRLGTETGGFDAKQLVDWDLQDKQIASQEAIAKRALAAAARDNRYVPAGQQPPRQLDFNQLKATARQRFAQGMMDEDEYNTVVKELVKGEALQKNPLQFYMNDLQNDLTGFYNQKLRDPNKPEAQWDLDPSKNIVRTPETIQKYLDYIQGDPDWRTMAQGDLGDENNLGRYIEFVKQIQKKWQDQQAQQATQESSWWPWR